MVLKKKCLDTYALAEIAQGNPNFATYLNQEIVITEITLAEFYAVLLRENGKDTAESWLKRLMPYATPVKLNQLIEAVKFRYQHRQQNLSFFDAVGYIYSLHSECLFVTGDKEFEHLKNVEFRK